MTRLGYAGICVELREKGVYTNRTITLKKLAELGTLRADELACQNITDLIQIIKYNEKIGIRFFRITSDLFPHMENPKAERYEMSTRAKSLLASAGLLARQLGHRLTMHPGQYAQLGSPREEVVEQTIRDLIQHALILDIMGMKPELGSVIIIHGGGTFGDKSAAIDRIVDNFSRLPDFVKKYIVFENDEFQYSVLDLLPLCVKLNTPLCIDFFHHSVRDVKSFDLDDKILEKTIATWTRRGIRPKCHMSDQRPDSKPGAHSDFIDELPRPILNFARKYGVDIMCECKQKEQCVFRLLKKYFTLHSQVIDGQVRIDWILG